MRASFLDLRVRREARRLVRAARMVLAAAATEKSDLRGKARDLETATASMAAALAARDAVRMRRQLPVLDALVDELKRQSTSTIRDYVESIGTAILIALALRAFVVEAFKIPSSS